MSNFIIKLFIHKGGGLGGRIKYMKKLYFLIILTLGAFISLQSASAAMTYGATTATSDGNYTLDGITSSAFSFGPAITTGSIVLGSGLTSGTITIGGASQSGDIIFGPTGATSKIGIGTSVPTSHLQIDGNLSATAWTTDGIAFDSNAATYTDTSTAGAGTVAVRTANSFGAPTFASTNAITVTDAFSLYVPKPIAGTNTTITRANSAYFEGNVGIGTTTPGQTLDVTGNINSSTGYYIGSYKFLSKPASTTISLGINTPEVATGNSVYIGYGAGYSTTSTYADNVFIGSYAGNLANAWGGNVIIGSQAGKSTTTMSGGVIIGYLAGGTGNITGVRPTLVGYLAGKNLTSGIHATVMGYAAGEYMSTGGGNTFIGYKAGQGNTTPANNTGSGNTFLGWTTGNTNSSGIGNTFLGTAAGTANTTGSFNIFIGGVPYGGVGAHSTLGTENSSIVIGYKATATASNQLVIGSEDPDGAITDAYFGSGVVKASPAAITLNATGGSGTDNAGANLVLAGGKGTGNSAGGNLLFQTSNAGASSATLQSLTTKMQITPTAVNMFIPLNYGTLAGGTTAYTLAVPLTALTDGVAVSFKVNAASTGASTLNVNSLGARKMIKGSDNSTQINNTDLVLNGTYQAIYNTSLDTGTGAWVIIGK